MSTETKLEKLELEEVRTGFEAMDVEMAESFIDEIGSEKVRRSQKKQALLDLQDELGGEKMAEYLAILQTSSFPNDKQDLILDSGPIYEALFKKGDFVSLINPDSDTPGSVQFARTVIKSYQSSLGTTFLIKRWQEATGKSFTDLSEADRKDVKLKDYVPTAPVGISYTMRDIGVGAFREFARKNGIAEKVHSPSTAGSTIATNLSLGFLAM